MPGASKQVPVLPATKLQEQLDALWKIAPRLCPIVRPKGMNDQALAGLAEREPNGKKGLQQLRGVLEEAAQACRCCEICGQPGEAVVDGTSQAIGDERGGADPAELRLATVWRLSFTSKTMSLATAKFACGHCRSLLETSAFVNFSAVADRGAAADASEKLMRTLCSHMVELNEPEGIDPGNEVAAAAWTQEVFALAYSLQVVASNVRGWQVVDADGQPLKYKTVTGSTAEAARALLTPRDPPAKKRKPKSPMERPPRVGGDATPASKAKKKAKKVPKTPMTEPRKVRGPLVLASAGKGNTAGGKAKGMKKRRLST